MREVLSMSVTVQYASDWHNEWMPADGLIPMPIMGDILVLAGDIVVDLPQLQAILEKIPETVSVIYVLGNHEYYGWDWAIAERAYAEAVKAWPHVYLLQNHVAVVRGIRFVGTTLWSALAGRLPPDAYRGKVVDYDQIVDSHGRPIWPEHTQLWHRQSVDFLRRTLSQPWSGPTIVVTHHAPSFLSEHPQWAGSDIRGAFCSSLENIIEAYRPDVWIHGHVHESCDYVLGQTRIVCNPLGVWGMENPEFNPTAMLVL